MGSSNFSQGCKECAVMSTKKPRNDRNKFEKPKSKLFTPDPYYIPGYCGYCPMKKFQLGDTYGKTTADILTNDDIAKSQSLVLKRKVLGKEDKSSRIKKQTREKKQGEPSYNIISGDMIPGYTGYIAKSEKYYGDRFAVICDHATSDIMEKNEIYRNQKQNQLNKELPSLRPIKKEAAKYCSSISKSSGASPYFSNDEKGKSFISGYTGFIPHARSLYAKGYPDQTRDALVEFTKDMQNNNKVEAEPVRLVREEVKRPRNFYSKALYDGGRPLLPRYTGYLPGHKFRYALTYGNSSLIQAPYTKN